MIVVVGGGTMGAGIAVSFLAVGSSVTVVEADDSALHGVEDRIRDSLERLARKSTLDVDDAMGRLSLGTDHPAPLDVELVVEAVPESMELKQSVFRVMNGLYPAPIVLASNTSSLSIETIAEVVDRPGRCIGMHFFNPVPVSSLVELVAGPDTTDATIEHCRTLVEVLEKTPIVVADSPGFASSRLGLALGLEAIRMVEAGVAGPTDIDTAMELGYRHPMGPLRLTDVVGLDVRLAIAEHLAATLGPRFEPPELLREMVAEGLLGKKVGRGFYEW